MKQKNNKINLLSKPALNYSYDSSNSKNIFDTILPPEINQKIGLKLNEKAIKRYTIVGKPEWYQKIAKQNETQLRFISDEDSYLNQKKFIRQRTLNQNDSISYVSSSVRTRKFSDHKEKNSDSTSTNNANPINFDVVEQNNLIQQMKKIGDQIKINTQKQFELTQKLSIQDKLNETKNFNALNSYSKYREQWQEFNDKLKCKIAQRVQQTSLIDQQERFPIKLDTLNMLKSIQNQLTDDEEEHRKRPNPLGDMFIQQKRILKLRSEPNTIKNHVYNLIKRENLLYVPNSQKIKSNILNLQEIPRNRCQSEYQQLNISGTNVYDQEYQSITKIQNQRYKLFKQKLVDKSYDL